MYDFVQLLVAKRSWFRYILPRAGSVPDVLRHEGRRLQQLLNHLDHLCGRVLIELLNPAEAETKGFADFAPAAPKVRGENNEAVPDHPSRVHSPLGESEFALKDRQRALDSFRIALRQPGADDFLSVLLPQREGDLEERTVSAIHLHPCIPSPP